MKTSEKTNSVRNKIIQILFKKKSVNIIFFVTRLHFNIMNKIKQIYLIDSFGIEAKNI
jgi:hypothetical protein